MTSPYVEYLLREKAGIVLTESPTTNSVASLPTASTTPADSYPRPAGNIGDSTYLSLRHIDSARLMPIALTLMRTSFGPGAGTSISMNSRTSGPPAFANLTVRGMIVSLVGWNDAELRLFSRTELPGSGGTHVVRKIPVCTGSHIIGLKVPTVVECTIDAKTRNAGEPQDLYKTAR